MQKIQYRVHTIESNIRLFAGDYIIYREITDSSDIDKLRTDLHRLGKWAVENGMKINPGKSKGVSFTKAGVKERIRYQILCLWFCTYW
jgi:hypothetical protein